MPKIASYRELDVWNRSLDVTADIYRATRRFPREERFGLTQQVRRAAISITANIAERAGRGTTREYAQFVSVARGSAYEVEALVLVAQCLGYLDDAEVEALLITLTSVMQMLTGLRRALRAPARR